MHKTLCRWNCSCSLNSPLVWSFEEGKFSKMYKCASMTPLLKKQEPDADLLSNYRPVSNLHTISKIVERVFMTRLAEHVKLWPNYNRFQSAYRRGHSRDSAVDTVERRVQRSRQWIQNSAHSTWSYSCIWYYWHKHLALPSPLFLWYIWTSAELDFVIRCWQNTVRAYWTGTVAQNWLRIRSSPRLCSLAAVIYLVHITCRQRNQFVRNWPRTVRWWHTVVHWKMEALPALTQCIQALHHWLDYNGLCLNPEKTEAVVLGTISRQRPGQQINTFDTGTVHIKTSDCVKSLGVLTERTISFNQHVNKICKTSCYHIKAIRHIRKLLSDDTARTVAWKTRLLRCSPIRFFVHEHRQTPACPKYTSQGGLKNASAWSYHSDTRRPTLASCPLQDWIQNRTVHLQSPDNSATAVFVRTHLSLRDSKTATTSRCQHPAVQSSSSQLL